MGGGGGGGGEGGGQVIGTMQVDTGQVVIFIPENNGPWKAIKVKPPKKLNDFNPHVCGNEKSQ